MAYKNLGSIVWGSGPNITGSIAYVSNNQLYITNIVVLDSMRLGKWRMATQNGLAFQWIGG